MSNINGGSDTQQEFFAEVGELKDVIEHVKANISRIDSLHQRSLTDIDESTSSRTQQQLDSLITETSALNKNLANRIKKLKAKAASDPSKTPQVNNLDRSFKDTLRSYQGVEAAFQKRAREQMARQYRIVRPDASDQEVEEACNDGQGQQIFSQAVRLTIVPPLPWRFAFRANIYGGLSFFLAIVAVKLVLRCAKSKLDTMRSSALRRPSLSLPIFSPRWSN